MDVTFRPAERADMDRVVELIVEQNAHPELQCLHLGDTVEEVDGEIHACTDTPESLFVVAERKAVRADDDQHGGLVGVLGADLDTDARKAWLWGPYVRASNDAERARVASALLEHLPSVLAVTPVVTHAYPNERARWIVDLLKMRGFDERSRAHVYVADAAARVASVAFDPRCVDLHESQTLAFTALHEQLFPDTWCSAEEILGKREGGDRVLVVPGVHDGTIDGYIHAGIADGGVEGYVHFLGVAPDRQRQGIGGLLLRSAMAWLFSERRVPRIGLTVLDSVTNAQALYERSGFRLAHTGVALRRSDES